MAAAAWWNCAKRPAPLPEDSSRNVAFAAQEQPGPVRQPAIAVGAVAPEDAVVRLDGIGERFEERGFAASRVGEDNRYPAAALLSSSQSVASWRRSASRPGSTGTREA